MVIDLGVTAVDRGTLDSMVRFSKKLGISGIAVSNLLTAPFEKRDDGFLVLKRVNISAKRFSSFKKRVAQERRRTAVIAVPLSGNLEIVNWAAEDNRVDLITLDPRKNHQLRSTTASLAANGATALELQFNHLLRTSGIARSKILKRYREALRTAIDAAMPVVLTSGAQEALELRAPVSIRHIGSLLGIEFEGTRTALLKYTESMVEKNLKKLANDFIAEGIEVVEEGKRH